MSKDLKLSRQMIRKALKTKEEAVYQRKKQVHPKLGDFQSQQENTAQKPAKKNGNSIATS